MVSDMGEDLPILKGILNGVVKYHNARTYSKLYSSYHLISSKHIFFLLFLTSLTFATNATTLVALD